MNRESVPRDRPEGPRRRPRRIHPGAIAAVIVFAGVASPSSYALLSTVLDGFAAAAIVVPPAMAGLWLVPLFRLGPMPLRWHLLLGATFGLGGTATLVLLLGLAGLIDRWLWISMLVAMFAAGGLRLFWILTGPARTQDSTIEPALRCLWVLIAPFLVLALLAAVHAPGYLWSEEGWGYDALEYHLALPKEYKQAERITYTPHNVYGNFPANVEMLYLAAMIAHGESLEAGTTAHMIHLGLAVLTAFAAYVAGREWSRGVGTLAAVLVGTCNWPVYLSGLAFVENGLLLFGMTAVAATVRALRGTRSDTEQSAPAADSEAAQHWKWFAVAGAAAGLACGCKYTAVPMIAVPIAAIAWLGRETRSRRLTACAVFLIASGVTFAPWLLKNLVMTGNPVFPLANRWFEATPPGWGMAESAHWDECHTAASNASAAPRRLRSLWMHILNDRYGRFGPMLFLLAIAGLLVRRPDRTVMGMILLALLQVVFWLAATHLYARFAVVLLLPLAVLGSLTARSATTAPRAWVLVAVTAVGAGVNLAQMVRLYRADAVPGATAPASLIYEGRLPGTEHLALINRATPADARVLVLGDAKAFYYDRDISYCVVFNRNPFVTAVRKDDSPRVIARWLTSHGYTHVLVHHAEIKRLRRSAYGFPELIDRALFDRLERAGVLRRITPDPRGSSPVDVYAVD